jgi:hypothetical protein
MPRKPKPSHPARPKLFGRYPDEIEFTDGYVTFSWEWPGSLVEVLVLPGGVCNWRIDLPMSSFLGTGINFASARRQIISSARTTLKALRTIVEGR